MSLTWPTQRARWDYIGSADLLWPPRDDRGLLQYRIISCLVMRWPLLRVNPTPPSC